MTFRFLYRVQAVLHTLLFRNQVEQEMDEELRYHIDRQIEANLQSGMSEADAQRAAMLALSGFEQVKARCREMQVKYPLEVLLNDFRFGLRSLRRNPLFSIIVLTSLTIGIGINAALFSVVKSVFFRPLPYAHADRLVQIWDRKNSQDLPLSYPEYKAWEEQLHLFDSLAAYFTSSYMLQGPEPVRVHVLRGSSNLLPMLGVTPSQGRFFRADEDARGTQRVVLLSSSFRRQHFPGVENVIGSMLKLDDDQYLVIGVLPDDFHFAHDADLWAPLRLDSTVAPADLHLLNVVGMLQPSTTIQDLNRNSERYAVPVDSLLGDHINIHAISLQQQLTQQLRPALIILMVVVAFVLLLITVNTANLLMARAAARANEIAVRLALGAERIRLVYLFLVESLVLAISGGVLAVGVAWLMVRMWGRAAPQWFPRAISVQLDSGVLAFALLLSLIVGVIFGLIPALRSARGDSFPALQNGSQRSGTTRVAGRIQSILVIAEITIAVVLVMSAAFALHSFLNVLNVNKGFDSDRVLALDVQPISGVSAEAETRFYALASTTVDGTPGIQSVGLTSLLPLSDVPITGGVQLEGDTPGSSRQAEKVLVDAGFFRVLHIPLLQGRFFAETDRKDTPPVALVNHVFFERYLAGKASFNQRVDLGMGKSQWLQVIGVVGDIRDENLEKEAVPTVYVDFVQHPDLVDSMGLSMVVRSDMNSELLHPTLHENVTKAGGALLSIKTFGDVLTVATRERSVTASLLGGFAALALGLAAIGIYGMLSYSVTQRTREIGIRMALGAQRFEVFYLVLRNGIRLVMIGLVLGVLGTWASFRLARGLLFEVRWADPITLLITLVVLTAAGLLASLLPAWRAMRLNPLDAVRQT